MPPGKTEDLLPAGLWADLREPGVQSAGPVWVAIEDDYGVGAAVAVVGMTDDGRFEVDGWRCDGLGRRDRGRGRAWRSCG